MRTNRLGRSGVEVTELGFGGGPLGGLYAPLDDATAADALQAAWQAGVRYFDTAPHYGIGHSERRTGALLARHPAGSYTVSTKVGRLLVPQQADGATDPHFHVPATHRRVWDFSRNGVRTSLADSQERLGVERVDAAYLHDAENHAEAAFNQGYPALAELREQGLVGAIGAGMHDSALLTRLVRTCDVDVVMVSGRFTLLDHSALDDLMPACTQRGVSVLAASVFNSGLLARAEPDEDAYYDYAPAGAAVRERARALAEVCAGHGVTLPQAALAFPLRHPAVAAVVVGMRTAEEVHADTAAFEAPVPEALWSDLRRAGLIDPRAPEGE
ncbi:aldo/keto reductase [Streptomonospora wellingtoniae]|uniref:Aldo/keto reductase n=1 Tax=Streptomonospora wellingtoniae TaxID=3075544 RepID=A0ABU2L077_9ACTN|nr:aldo/keto reductase [Streptomonospora sp. DSM 45055]MDT0304960.1 aldo/keto reductase [Streptomonospora sp. DSM 45055]